MKRLIVISDTHIRTGEMPQKLYGYFEKADYIVHAGDFMNPSILDELEAYAPVYAVCGNNDYGQLSNELSRKRVFKIEDVNIGLTHGFGYRMDAFKNAQAIFASSNLDIVIYGHSHRAKIIKVGKTTYFNPGSPTRPRGHKVKTIGEIIIDKDMFNARIIAF